MSCAESSVLEWRKRYGLAGITTIPLRANEKKPMVDKWQIKPTETQWQSIGQTTANECNIGIRLSDGLAAIDCDNPYACDHVMAFLTPLGLNNTPQVTTRRGKHIYLRVYGAPPDFTCSDLVADVGKGELRVSRCYVVAPMSHVSGHAYYFAQGSPEALAGLPAVKWEDLMPLVGCAAATPQLPDLPTLTVPLLKRWGLPKGISHTFYLLRWAARGEAIEEHATRSQAEMSIVAKLILHGHSYSQILALFKKHNPGHFQDAGSGQLDYLQRTFSSALQWLASFETRKAVAEAYRRAEQSAWPGRTGGLDSAVYRALLSICWAQDSWTIYAATRDISELACTAGNRVGEVIDRLVERQLVVVIEPALYRGRPVRVEVRPVASLSQISSYTPTPPVIFGQSTRQPETTQLWATLGRACGQVYMTLDATQRSIVELVNLTGKHRGTVWNSLRKLEALGLATRVVGTRPTGVRWIRGTTDVLEVAESMGAMTKITKRLDRHKDEREAHKSYRPPVQSPPADDPLTDSYVPPDMALPLPDEQADMPAQGASANET